MTIYSIEMTRLPFLDTARGYAARVIIASVAVLALSSCGQSIVTITQPTHPIYVGCHGSGASDARILLGQSFRAAETKIPASLKGCTIRAVKINGRAVPIITDYSTNRIDVAVKSGLVVRIVKVG